MFVGKPVNRVSWQDGRAGFDPIASSGRGAPFELQ